MRLVLDRIEKTDNEQRIAVFECGSSLYSIYENDMPYGFINQLKAGMIIEAEIKDDTLISPRILYKETEEKQQIMNDRLCKLFNRNKK